jgi:phosphodiesterase/alkaline phosphatase D-like protein
MARMTLGPVIGLVRDTSARVLVEADGDAEVTCRLAGADGIVRSQTASLSAGRPRAFEVSGLTPESAYTVTFGGLSEPRAGRVTTFASDTTRMNVALASCNNTPRRGDTELWQDLFDRYVTTGDVQLMVHAGDQVYGDRAFEGAMRLLDGRTRARKKEEAEILETYRQLYRWAWNHPPTRSVLANVANLMIWDDHEIRDDWGSRTADGLPNSAEYYVGSLARRVYREYQRQLWEDVDDDADAPAGQLEHHEHMWGSIAILFVDQRGARSFARDPTRPFLGSQQWGAITTSLKTGALSAARALMVVTSVPLVYLGTSLSSDAADLVDDLRDHWGHSLHQKEQIEMIRALRVWKEERPDRELLVLGGDVHVGGHTEIRHDGKPIYRQLISSAITNAAPAFLAYAAIRLLLETGETLAHGYSFEHLDFTRRRNYGIVIVRVPAAGGRPTVEGSLVTAP